MSNFTDFKSDQTVRYTGRALNGQGIPFLNELATVICPIKSRKVIHIRWNNPKFEYSFEANPLYLEIIF